MTTTAETSTIITIMAKHRPPRVVQRLLAIEPWVFLAVAIVSGVICIFALRANNEHMAKLRNEVYSADQANGDVQGALNKLQAYVTAHMNTSLDTGNTAVYPPIQLKYTYDRLVQTQSDRLSQTNAQLYTEAQHYCEQQNSVDFSGHNRVPCIEQYVQSHGVSIAPIPDALYKFDFISPTWSPDLAGWSLLVLIGSVILCILTFLVKRFRRDNK